MMRSNDGHETPRGPHERSEESIALLLRATGRRPVVPADRADRVKAAVRDRWRAEVRRRSRRRTTWVAASLAAAAGLAAVAIGLGARQRAGPPSALPIAATVEAVRNAVASGPAAPALRPGETVAVGSHLATAEGGRLALRLRSGHSVRFDSGTRARVLSEREIGLERGALYVDSLGPDGPAQGAIEVRTPFASVRHAGTQFEVRLLATSLRVRVREGAVVLDRPLGRIDLAEGEEVELAGDGRVTRRESSGFGIEWAWVAEIAPPMAIDGRPLREFLDWLVRERGLSLEFEGAGIEGVAAETRLRGSIEGMSLDEALESVLATCGLASRVEEGVLVVAPPPRPA